MVLVGPGENLSLRQTRHLRVIAYAPSLAEQLGQGGPALKTAQSSPQRSVHPRPILAERTRDTSSVFFGPASGALVVFIGPGENLRDRKRRRAPPTPPPPPPPP